MTASVEKGRLFTAPRLLADPDRWIDGGGVLVRGGRIERVLDSPAAVRGAAQATDVHLVELPAEVLTPGLVNAHAHLELSAFHDRLPQAKGFVPWIKALLLERAKLKEPELRSAAALGAERALATGTTCIGDIASMPLGEGVALDAGLRACMYREVLDAWKEERTEQALAPVRRALPVRRMRVEGLSPHAPYTTSSALLEHLGKLASKRHLPVACHWSETEEEVAWMMGEESPFEALVGCRGPGESALELLDRAGLLGSRTALIHGNAPQSGEIARIARAGASVVHCPGTHAFFDRPDFPWKDYLQAGVSLALGTDSLASNEDLDLGREMRLARREAPFLTPERVWEMATLGGARALGMAGQVGVLREGALADLVGWGLKAKTKQAALEQLVEGASPVCTLVVGGRRRLIESRDDLP